MRITVKNIVLFLVACVVAGRLVTMWIENHPHHDEVIDFVRSNQQVIGQVGSDYRCEDGGDYFSTKRH